MMMTLRNRLEVGSHKDNPEHVDDDDKDDEKVDEEEGGRERCRYGKDEKRVMYLVKIVKFYDATLEKVLKEVKLKIFQSEPRKKPPLLGELDRDIMRSFEREMAKRLSHHEQMRR
ncbi:hypothetical protein Tco_0786622 [Tanacetum coccineum]